MSSLTEKLEAYAKHHLNVLLVGSHGIGKSTIVKGIADTLGLKFKYYSSSTLDPFADLVGIPSPNKETGSLQFYRPSDIENAEFILFDEINRAHPRVLNAVLEIIQFKTVNGYRLPNLKMVWACMNPPGEDYQVEQLDPALIDRFHVFIKMNAEINLDYMSTKMRPDVAKMLKDWWETNLNIEQRKVFTPRRIEYLGFLISNNISWRDCFPQGHIFPIEDLAKKIRILNNEEEDIIINHETILKHKDKLYETMKKRADIAIPISEHMKKFNDVEIFACRDLLESMPKELVKAVGECKFPIIKRNVKDAFVKAGIDFSQYPKISETFNFV